MGVVCSLGPEVSEEERSEGMHDLLLRLALELEGRGELVE
jgi:hypothetical protein